MQRWKRCKEITGYIETEIINSGLISVYPELDYSKIIDAKPQKYSDIDDQVWFLCVKRAVSHWMLERDQQPPPSLASTKKVSYPCVCIIDCISSLILFTFIYIMILA